MSRSPPQPDQPVRIKDEDDYAGRDKRGSVDAAGICFGAIAIMVIVGFVHYVFWG
jgi:hypothetical protein